MPLDARCKTHDMQTMVRIAGWLLAASDQHDDRKDGLIFTLLLGRTQFEALRFGHPYESFLTSRSLCAIDGAQTHMIRTKVAHCVLTVLSWESQSCHLFPAVAFLIRNVGYPKQATTRSNPHSALQPKGRRSVNMIPLGS